MSFSSNDEFLRVSYVSSITYVKKHFGGITPLQGPQQLMNSLSTEILTAWQDYVKTSGMEKSRIPASKIHEHQQFFINKQNCTDAQNGANIKISTHMAKYYQEYFVKKDKNGNIKENEPLNILFPILRCTEIERGRSVVKYLPLFSYQLPRSFFQSGSENIFLPVKDGQQIQALNAVFRDIFDIDLTELGEDRHMMSIISALNSEKYESFYAAFEGLIKWVSDKLGNRKNIVLENAFNTLITPIYNEDFNTQRDGKDFKWLCENPTSSSPLLEKYLTHTNIEENLPVSDTIIYGLFEAEHPLGHGQIQAIQAINGPDTLVAVQGAPGTGKTTLFKSLIAQQVVQKALAIINNKDCNLSMLVTSTAIKAVENIIDDLRKDPLTQDLNWLWFHSGSKDQIQKELSRIENLLLNWQEHEYDQLLQEIYRQTLLAGQSEINNCIAKFTQLRALSQQALNECLQEATDINQLTAYLSSCWNQLQRDAQACNLRLTGENSADLHPLLECILSLQDDFKQKQVKRDTALQQARALEAIWPIQQGWEEIRSWLSSPILQPLSTHYQDYPMQGFAAVMARIFKAKYSLRRDKVKEIYPAEFQQFKLDTLSHAQLAELIASTKKLMSNPTLVHQLDSLMEPEPDQKMEANRVSLKQALQEMQTRLMLVEKARKANSELQQQFPEGNSSDILRKRFIQTHRRMFEAAVGFIWQEQLKQKQTLKEVLTHWKAMIAGVKSPGYYRWMDKLDEFYTSLSLVYPVMATTLVSAYKTAGYSKLEELKEYKPWNIVLCDEAGMISAESVVPLLCRSKKAIIVGDPLQIEPIRNIPEGTQERLRDKYFAQNNTLYERVSPVSVTAYHRAAGCHSGLVTDKGHGIILDEHRRCQPQIASLFSQLAGYQGISVETGKPNERIAAAFEKMGQNHLMFYSVEGKKGAAINTNLDEVDAIEQLLDKLEEAGYDLHKDIGIVTPYANQKTLLIQKVGERLNHKKSLAIGTVHQFQGVGFEVIIYSPVIFHPSDSAFFQNNSPNMLNVVVSRAKQQFIVVGNYYRLRQANGYLKTMAETVANSFLLEQGSQTPAFEELSQSPRLQRYFRDCEHISAFTAHAATCDKELIVITPWIRNHRGSHQQPQLELLSAAQQRGINVKVYYGYFHIDLKDKEDQDENLIELYRQRLGESNVIRLEEGTHEKILMIDNYLVTLGSWNWLSHNYDYACKQSTTLRNAIRHEVSAELNDPAFVAEWKARLNA